MGYFRNTLVQMADVDGVNDDKYVWNKIDHCQYTSPKEIMTRCHIASASPDQCVRELTNMRHESECKKNCNNRYGVNVVPLANPKQVMFKVSACNGQHRPRFIIIETPPSYSLMDL